MEPCWASKIDHGSPGWFQDPPKSEPNLDRINHHFEARVGLHFGGRPCGAAEHFFGAPSWSPCWGVQVGPLIILSTVFIEPNVSLKMTNYKVQVGLRFGRGATRASQDRFVRPNLAPCWPHVSSQHEPMLDCQHGLMLRANMGPPGRARIDF